MKTERPAVRTSGPRLLSRMPTLESPAFFSPYPPRAFVAYRVWATLEGKLLRRRQAVLGVALWYTCAMKIGSWVRTVWEAVGPGIVAGAACGVVMAYLLSDHRIGWGNLAEWITGLATTALVIVAWVQLGRFVENERAKYTLDQIAVFFDRLHIVQMNEPLTVDLAAGIIHSLLLNPQHLFSFQRMLRHSGLIVNESLGVQKDYMQKAAAFVVCTNYFGMAASLIARHLIVEELFVSKFPIQLVELYRFCKIMAEVDPAAKRYLADPDTAELTELGKIEWTKQMGTVG
jgi:hypothetical protein